MDHVYTDHSYWECRDKIRNGNFSGCFTKNAKFANDITWQLVIHNVPFHVVNYGSGVKRFLKNGTVCDKCHGRGSIQEK